MELFNRPEAGSARTAFLKKVNRPLFFRAFLLRSLPAALFSGLRLHSATEDACTVSVPYGWRTQNPFRSTYFASLAMAAEMSTGVLAMAALQGLQPPVSMLIVSMEAEFLRKATGLTFFTCKEGAALRQAIAASVASGEGAAVQVLSEGSDEEGNIIARFRFTWSFRPRRGDQREA